MEPDEKYSGFVFPCREYKKIQPIKVTALAKSIRHSLAWPLTDTKGKPLYKEDGTPATENKLEVESFTPHDMRRTAASFMASLDFMDEIIDAVLNHVKKGIIATYNRHGYDSQKQKALEAWSRKLNSIISGSECKVIPISAGKKAA
jgi:integrase